MLHNLLKGSTLVLCLGFPFASAEPAANHAAENGKTKLRFVNTNELSPTTVKVRTFRNVDPKIFGAEMADILNHAGRIDNEADKITRSHETVHFINSEVRNLPENLMMQQDGHGNGRSRGAAFYIGEGKAVTMEEPKKLRKSWVNAFIPPELRGPVFRMYLMDSRGFDDIPLNIMDEFTAYVMGCRAGVGLAKIGRWDEGWRNCSSNAVEFIAYGLALAQALKKYEPDYYSRQPNFSALLKLTIERTVKIDQEAQTFPDFKDPKTAETLKTLRTSPGAEGLRQTATDLFGTGWTQSVLGF